ncbi:unnamed protein product [Ixodes hexagonus]
MALVCVYVRKANYFQHGTWSLPDRVFCQAAREKAARKPPNERAFGQRVVIIGSLAKAPAVFCRTRKQPGSCCGAASRWSREDVRC